jgi:hypothetical protein
VYRECIKKNILFLVVFISIFVFFGHIQVHAIQIAYRVGTRLIDQKPIGLGSHFEKHEYVVGVTISHSLNKPKNPYIEKRKHIDKYRKVYGTDSDIDKVVFHGSSNG